MPLSFHPFVSVKSHFILIPFSQHTGGAPVLTKKSRPAEVKAWLEDKGFSKM